MFVCAFSGTSPREIVATSSSPGVVVSSAPLTSIWIACTPLVCGCPYRLEVVSYSGDTTVIPYDVPIWRNFPGEVASTYGVVFKGADGAATGSYSTQMIVKGGGEGYLDTINATYTVQ